jgi:hypothetical protein
MIPPVLVEQVRGAQSLPSVLSCRDPSVPPAKAAIGALEQHEVRLDRLAVA